MENFSYQIVDFLQLLREGELFNEKNYAIFDSYGNPLVETSHYSDWSLKVHTAIKSSFPASSHPCRKLEESGRFSLSGPSHQFRPHHECLLAALKNAHHLTPAKTLSPISQASYIPLKQEYTHHFFVSYSSYDKPYVSPLVEHLKLAGFELWYDEDSLQLGNSLRRGISEGLLYCQHALIILSRNFIQSKWTQFEINGLNSREMLGEDVIVPIWHNISAEEIKNYSLPLLDKLGLKSDESYLETVKKLKTLFK